MTDVTRAIDVAWPQDTWRQWVRELQAENAQRREDIAWLYAQMAGEPYLATERGETHHEWTMEGYETRTITDYGSDLLLPSEHKLRRVKCATCGQTWTHP